MVRGGGCVVGGVEEAGVARVADITTVAGMMQPRPEPRPCCELASAGANIFHFNLISL